VCRLGANRSPCGNSRFLGNLIGKTAVLAGLGLKSEPRPAYLSDSYGSFPYNSEPGICFPETGRWRRHNGKSVVFLVRLVGQFSMERTVARSMSLQNFMSAHSPKDGDGFIETARLIAGEAAPSWLTEHLQSWSPSVMLDGLVHAMQLGKAEARSRLRKLSEAAELVERELQDPVLDPILEAEEFGPMPANKSMDAVLREIHRRAELSSSRLNLLATGLDERLERLGDSAKLVARELQDSAISDFLRAEQREPSPDNIQFGKAVLEIKRQAESALLSDYLATKTGKTKAGRSRA
jgi:hypothetical protein